MPTTSTLQALDVATGLLTTFPQLDGSYIVIQRDGRLIFHISDDLLPLACNILTRDVERHDYDGKYWMDVVGVRGGTSVIFSGEHHELEPVTA